MQNGVVKWFSDQKGFGFISSEGKDFFVYFKEISMDGYKSLKQGDKVSFKAVESAKGPMATSVCLDLD